MKGTRDCIALGRATAVSTIAHVAPAYHTRLLLICLAARCNRALHSGRFSACKQKGKALGSVSMARFVINKGAIWSAQLQLRMSTQRLALGPKCAASAARSLSFSTTGSQHFIYRAGSIRRVASAQKDIRAHQSDFLTQLCQFSTSLPI